MGGEGGSPGLDFNSANSMLSREIFLLAATSSDSTSLRRSDRSVLVWSASRTCQWRTEGARARVQTGGDLKSQRS